MHVEGDNCGIIITGNDNIINLPKEDLLEKEIVIETFRTYYQNHFKTISLLIEDDKKPIDDIYVNLAIIKEEKEEDIKDKSKLLDRDKIINSYEEIYKPKEPIVIEKLIEKSSKHNSAKALIYGKAGIGKTTLCKYIAYKWAKGELYSEFENIVYISLREWREDGLESVVKKIYFQEKYKDYVIEIDQSKTLFLFDGYDELSDTFALHNAIKTYNLQNYIITSRPYGYRKSDFDVNEVFETIGFTDENVTAYIDKFFEEQSHKTNLQNFLKQNINIKHIAYIPLILEMTCSLWREKTKRNQSFVSLMTMTELYGEVTEYIFFEYTETNDTAYIQEKEDEIFDYLGKIAFGGLKRKVIVLDKSIIKEKKEFFVDYVLKTGFLRSDRKHRNQLKNSYEFLHLTFQEYFAALYVSKLPKEEICEIIREYKFYPYMQVFFSFLSGLIEDKEFLLREIENQPKDTFGSYECLLIINVFTQIKKEDITLKQLDKLNDSLISLCKINFYKIRNIFSVVNHFDNKKFTDWVFESMENNKFKSSFSFTESMENSKFKSSISLYDLAELNKYNPEFLDNLISIIKNEEIDVFARRDAAKAIGDLDRNNYKLIYRLKQLIEDESIDENIRMGAFSGLIKLGKEDKQLFSTIMKIVKSEKIWHRVVEYGIISLANLGRNDNQLIDILLSFIKVNYLKDDFTLSFCDRATAAAEALGNLGRNDNEFVHLIIKVVKDENIDMKRRVDIVTKTLMNIGRSDNEFLDILLEVRNDENINYFVRVTAGQLWSHIKGKDDYEYNVLMIASDLEDEKTINPTIINNFINIIDNNMENECEIIKVLLNIMEYETIDPTIRGDILEVLINFKSKDPKVINTLSKAIGSVGINLYTKKYVAKYLISIDSAYSEVLDMLLEVLLDKSILFSEKEEIVKMISPFISNDYRLLNEFPICQGLRQVFLRNVVFISFFKAYEDGLVELSLVMESANMHYKPLYVKDNKLCTVFENKELKSGNGIDEKLFIEIVKKIKE